MATVALVGANRTPGRVMLAELIASDAIMKVYCLSRKDIRSSGPKVANFRVDYSKPQLLEAALQGCDVLINTMGTEGNYEER